MKGIFLSIFVFLGGCVFAKQPSVSLASAYEKWGSDCLLLIDSPVMGEFSGSYYRLAEYPAIARLLHIEGWVVVAIKVLKSGEVGDVLVLESYPNQMFNQSAIQESFNRRYSQLEAHEPRSCYIDIYRYAFDLP